MIAARKGMAGMTGAIGEKPGGGFTLLGLLTGLAAGGACYAIGEFWIGEEKGEPAALTAFFAVAVFAASFLLIAERRASLRAILPASVIAALLSASTWHMLKETAGDASLDTFPMFFWFFIGAPLAGYLMAALFKGALLDGAPPPYRAVFFHGLTLPLIAAGAHLFAVLTFVLLFAWAQLLQAMNVDFFHELFQKPWFMLPVFGAVGGLSIAMMRSLDTVLGALRYLLLLFSRLLMPITAVFSITFVAVIAVNGPDAILESRFYPGGLMLGLSFVGMLIFNGVYQNGEGGPPPLWLRLATLIALLAFPIYSGLAAHAFWLRIGEYGLTPARVIGAAMTGLAALYAIVCLAGILTELNWRGRRWMPLVAPFNTGMAAVWVCILLLLASPILNPWALSARSQEARLAEGRVTAAAFDFGYLRFRLGDHGERALDRLLALESHPEAAAIRAGVVRARAASSQWTYERGEEPEPSDGAVETGERRPGPMQLELNPDGADYGDEDDPDAVSTERPASGEPQP